MNLREPVIHSSVVLLCPSCGQENPEVARFCLACGAALAEPGAAPEEERKVVTALFTDIVGSTASAEKMDPEDVRARLAPYYARVRTELERFGGTVEKFIGDAVVALFGAPVAHEDDPERAVRAAIAIRKAIEDLNAEDDWLDLHLRTAVHTGEAIVVLGSTALEGEGMAAGDVMNTAARLQSGAPVDGIVVGEGTYRATSTIFDYREGEPVQAKGKAEPVPIWEVVAEQEAPKRPAARTALVGRSGELAVLSDLWETAVAEGRPQLVTVLGPPGIGKSRLLLALSERAERDGAAHWGRCLPYGEGITYWPVTEILKSASAIKHDDDQVAISSKLGVLLESLPISDSDEVRTMAAAAANLLGVAQTPHATYSAEEIGQSELHWGVRRVLQLLAAERPLLLVFEDLHWAEPTLLDLIRSLADIEDRAPILVIGSARPELKESSPGMLEGGDNRKLLELAPLGEDESRALMVELVGDEVKTAQFEGLLKNAGGNPLFLEETVRMVADRALDPELPPDALPVPDNLQALIGSRLDALPAGDKRVAQQASVVGGVFWEGAVSHLDGSSGDLTGSLATLERRDFVQAHQESAIAEDREYAFKHILIRDVAYDRLPKGRRAELHVRFTDWLSGVPGPEGEFLEIVAYHLEQACQLAGQIARSPIEPPILDAAAALAGAAEKAQRREGLREAGRYYDRALALLGDRFPERSLELRLARAGTRTYLGELQQASEELAEAAEEALSLDRPDLRCTALVTLGNIDHRQSRPSQARRRLTEAQALAVQSGDRSLQVRSTFGLAAVRADHEGEAEAAVEDLRRALSVAEEMDDRALRVEGHLRLGFLLFNMGEIGASERELLRCTELAGELGSIRDEARAAFLLGLVKHYRGDPDEAERLSLQACDWLERTGEPYFQMQNFRALGLYALARGDLEQAESRLREAIPVAVEEGGREVLEVYRFLTETLVRQERIPDAVALVEFASRNVPEEDLAAQAHLLLARGAIAAAQGDREAFSLYARAINWLEEQFLPIEASEARITFAAALRRLGQLDDARTQLAMARETFERMGASGPCAQVDGELERIASGAG
jgi:class 3 adenylate cyclase/tetratricopeptide (TPR) repeat protein